MESESYVIKQRIDKTSLWKDSKPILGRLDMELTERCNNNCVHCCINLPQDELGAQERELSTNEIKRILKEAESLGCMSVRFTGGEPILREDFEELYIFARKQGLRVLIFTNATLITEQVADLFSRIPPLEKIEVTVYGMKKASYEGVTRVDGSFEAAWRGIALLLEKRVPFVVKSAILPSNRDEIDGFEEWAKKIPRIEDRLPSYSMFFDLRVRRDSEEKNRFIKDLRLSPQEGLRALVREKDSYIKEMKEFSSKFMRPSGDKLFSCGSGCGGGCIDAYGYFYPCLLLKAPQCAYPLKRGTLKDALTDFFPRLRETKATNLEYLRRCANCFLKSLCGQCPAKSWIEHGTLDTPVEYLCEIGHTRARFLGLLKDTENAWQVEAWEGRIRDFSA